MTIEIKTKIGHDIMFNIHQGHQANFKSAHLLHKMARGYIFIAGSLVSKIQMLSKCTHAKTC